MLQAAEKADATSRASASSSVIDLSREPYHRDPVGTNKEVLFAALIAQQETTLGFKQVHHQQKMLHLLKVKINSCKKELKLWKSMVSPSVITSNNENAEYIMTELKQAKKKLSDATSALNKFIAESSIPLSTPEQEVEKSQQHKNELMQLVGKALKPAADDRNNRIDDNSTNKRQQMSTPCSSINIPDNWNTPAGRSSTSS